VKWKYNKNIRDPKLISTKTMVEKSN